MRTAVHAHVYETTYRTGTKELRVSITVRVNGKPKWDVSTESVPREKVQAFIREQIQHFAWDNKKIEMPETYTLFETTQVNTDHEMWFLGE